MAHDPPEDEPARHKGRWRHAILGVIGIALGGAFLWLAVRDIGRSDLEVALRHVEPKWLIAGVAAYLGSIALRCVRWGILLRATRIVKWRHVAEALLAGFAANYLMPARVGELFRADYARRVFDMSRFTSLGTIFVERVCDGIALVCVLWLSFVWLLLTRFIAVDIVWILTVGGVATLLFGGALAFILLAGHINLRRFGMGEAITRRWDLLVQGVSSVLHGRAKIVALCSIGVWWLEVQALANLVRSFGVVLSLPEALLLQALASLSTLVPTAPVYLGTYQLVFREVFRLLGQQESMGVIAATAVQVFFFGTVTILGGIVLLSRSGVTLWRSSFRAVPNDIAAKSEN
jgi:glycosyltransferase 2 family protein